MDMDFQEGLLISIIVFIALSFGWLLIVFIARSFRDIYRAHEERRTMKKLIDDVKSQIYEKMICGKDWKVGP